MRSTRFGLAALALLGSQACMHKPADDAAWRAEIEAWKGRRLRSIAGEDGWITLVARSVLEPGKNTIGTAADNHTVLPKGHAPDHAASIFLEGDRLRLEVADGVTLTVDDKPVRATPIADDRDGKPTMMKLGSLTFHVIKRQQMFALRVKDRESPARARFAGLHYYPLDPRLRVRAHLEPAPAGKTIAIVNVLDQIEQMPSPGALRFSLDGVEHTLDAVREAGEDELFILFRDQTAGSGTYPSGRFLYTKLPDAAGNVELDFNRAYNPPCAFTAFATCPLPPRQNHLPRKIEAGEKWDGTHPE